VGSPRVDYFATPLWSTALDDADDLNPRLAEAVLAMRASGSSGQERSNTDGAWRSANKLFVDEPFAGLAARIGAFVTTEVALDLHLVNGIQVGMTEMWANVTPTGGRHRRHHHGTAYFSGVYYVAAGPDSGALVLHDPRDGAPILSRHWELSTALTPLTDPAPAVTARAGDLHVFHAWVQHEVQVNRSSEDRISISFNFTVQPGPST
jgi:uncharacterized protein (TIGR02466 family)